MHNDPTQWDQVCQMEFALLRFAATLPDVSVSVQDTVAAAAAAAGANGANGANIGLDLGLGLGGGGAYGGRDQNVVDLSTALGLGLGSTTATEFHLADASGGVGGFQTGVVEMDLSLGLQQQQQHGDPLLSSMSMPDLALSNGAGITAAEMSSSSLTQNINSNSNSNSNSNPSDDSTNGNGNTNNSLIAPSALDPELLLIHTLVHVATIQLFHPFAQKDASLHQKCLDAARGVTALLRVLLARPEAEADALVGALDPIMGTCCMCASDVFVREKMWHKEEERSPFKADDEIDVILCVLKKLGNTFPVAGTLMLMFFLLVNAASWSGH